MKRRFAEVMLLLLVAAGIAGCAQMAASNGGWITLIDGATGLDHWDRIGDANWRAEDGVIVADKGKGGFLVSKNSYKDFQIRAEFWADHTTNSGIFIRLSDPSTVTSANSYVVLNGVQTANVQHGKFAQGPFALQFANGPKDAPGGAIKWRKVQIREL